MKYGIIYHGVTPNFGDDILPVAASRLLPHTDYQIDINHLDTFAADEPVAAVMCSWFLLPKWNWPPARSIVPLFAGFHYSDHQQEIFRSPVSFEFLSGPGAAYMQAAEPIGCRDLPTCTALQELGFKAYFSGCITLTLSDIPVHAAPREYICLVDIPAKVEERIRAQLSGADIDILTFTHTISDSADLTWAQREQRVLERLSIYNGAKCVISNRLHVTLPCLAMETPVFTISNKLEEKRFSPYKDWFYGCDVKTFLESGTDYDFLNPPPNPTLYLPYREQLLATVRSFVERTQKITLDDIHYPYTEDEVIRWRHDLMKDALTRWIPIQRQFSRESAQLQRTSARYDKLQASVAEKNEKLRARAERIEDLKGKIAEKNDKLKQRAERIAALKAALKSSDDALQESVAKVSAMQSELLAAGEQIKEREAANRALRKTLEKQDQQIASQRKKLSYKSVRIALKVHRVLYRLRGGKNR